MGVEFTVSGLEELCQAMDGLVAKYPDKAGEVLRKEARNLRKDVVKKTREVTEVRGTKRSLGKIGSYKISQVMGIGRNQYVEISAKSPHFHLVEHGHNQLGRDGRSVGFVQGRHMMETTAKKYEEELPDAAQRMIDQLMQEGGLS